MATKPAKTGATPAPTTLTPTPTAPQTGPVHVTTPAHGAGRTAQQVWDNIKLQLLLALETTVYVAVTTWLFLAVMAAGIGLGIGIDWVQTHFPLTPHWMIFIAHCVEDLIYVGDFYGLAKRVCSHLFK